MTENNELRENVAGFAAMFSTVTDAPRYRYLIGKHMTRLLREMADAAILGRTDRYSKARDEILVTLANLEHEAQE